MDVPKKYTEELSTKRGSWGMFPITVALGDTTWNTKLMMKKGGYFFIALRAAVRKKEAIEVGDTLRIVFSLV